MIPAECDKMESLRDAGVCSMHLIIVSTCARCSSVGQVDSIAATCSWLVKLLPLQHSIYSIAYTRRKPGKTAQLNAPRPSRK